MPKVKVNIPARTVEVDVSDDLLESLRRLQGVPPYDGPSNMLFGDGYFAKDLDRKYTPDQLLAGNQIISEEIAAYKKAKEKTAKKLRAKIRSSQ